MHFVNRRCSIGRYITAVGNGYESARKIGVNVKGSILTSFVFSGAFAAIGGMMNMLQIGSVSAYTGQGMEFKAIASVVIGGISLMGGQGELFPGVAMGVLIMVMIRNGLNIIGMNPYTYNFINGAVIFLAMYIDSLKSKIIRPC
jgi:ribose/xylose/arabinose/galactoside ABC-type transport system permease subunit